MACHVDERISILCPTAFKIEKSLSQTMILSTWILWYGRFCKCRNIKIRLMSRILVGVLTEPKKIINVCPYELKR